MAIDDMTKLFKHELGDLLFAEKTFLKGLKAMAKETSNPAIKQRILEHASETEGHIDTLGRAFEAAGLKAKATKCDAALGLKEEHDSFKEEEDPTPEILEAFNLGSGLRVEHYEIAGYRSAIVLAQTLGFSESAALLQQILAQEEAMAKFLEAQAPGALASIAAEVEGEAGAEMEPAVEPEVARSRTQSRPSSGGSTRPSTGRSATAGR
jgi:ferritin-like metal-binding protein YciE